MCPINRLVVHHTWSLFKRSQGQHPEKAYGDKFTYNEILAMPSFPRAMLYLLGFSVFIVGLLFSPVRPPCLHKIMCPF